VKKGGKTVRGSHNLGFVKKRKKHSGGQERGKGSNWEGKGFEVRRTPKTSGAGRKKNRERKKQECGVSVGN